MAANPNTPDTFKKAVLKADVITKAQKKINPRFDLEISSSLPAAIKDKNGPKIELYQAALKAAMEEIEASLADVRSALLLLKDVEDDEEFVAAHLAAVEKVTTIVSDARASLTSQYQAGLKLQKQAEAALDGLRNTQDRAFQDLAQLDKVFDDEAKELRAAFQKADQLNVKAGKAAEARDEKSLADARKAMDGLEIDIKRITFDGNEKSLAEFVKDLDNRGYDEDIVAQLKGGARELGSRHAGTRVYIEQLEKAAQTMEEFKIEDVDVQKAMDALALDDKIKPRLAKVLEGPAAAYERGLAAIAKDFKLKTTGKDMLVTLKKRGIV